MSPLAMISADEKLLLLTNSMSVASVSKVLPWQMLDSGLFDASTSSLSFDGYHGQIEDVFGWTILRASMMPKRHI